MKLGLQIGDVWALGQAEGVQFRLLMPAESIGVDQPKHGRLTLGGLRRQQLSAARPAIGATRQARKGLADRAMRNIAALGGLGLRELAEIVPPLRRNRFRITQITLVVVFDEGGIGAE